MLLGEIEHVYQDWKAHRATAASGSTLAPGLRGTYQLSF